jgi:hypothetical protein
MEVEVVIGRTVHLVNPSVWLKGVIREVGHVIVIQVLLIARGIILIRILVLVTSCVVTVGVLLLRVLRVVPILWIVILDDSVLVVSVRVVISVWVVVVGG